MPGGDGRRYPAFGDDLRWTSVRGKGDNNYY